jgi:septal ring factor EnvC (AmiA/AmiB activator)
MTVLNLENARTCVEDGRAFVELCAVADLVQAAAQEARDKTWADRERHIADLRNRIKDYETVLADVQKELQTRRADSAEVEALRKEFASKCDECEQLHKMNDTQFSTIVSLKKNIDLLNRDNEKLRVLKKPRTKKVVPGRNCEV